MPCSRIRVAFRISGFSCSPDELTAHLGIEPSKAWSRGDKVGATALVRPENGWEIIASAPEGADLAGHIADVLSKLYPIKSRMSCKWGGRRMVSCVIYSYDGDRPPIFLDLRLLEEIVELGASIDIDIYNLPSDCTAGTGGNE
jgi:Domain of unknown function (DUF4279)